MSRCAITGYADLVRLADGPTGARLRELAELFGFECRAPEPKPPVILEGGDSSPQPSPQDPGSDEPALPPALVPFWRLVGYLPIPGSDKKDGAKVTPGGGQGVAYPGWRQRPATVPPFQPLATWRDLTVRLRHALGLVESGRSIDIDRVVERIGRGEVIDRLPRTALSRWCGRVQLIADCSRHLIPYFKDQHYVAWNIHRLVADHDFLYATLPDGAAVPVSYDRAGYEVDFLWPLPGTPVLVLGDLGCLTGSGDRNGVSGPRRFWLEFGQRLRAAGCRPVALFPAGLGRCPTALEAVWTVVPWERPRVPVAMEGTEAPAERLLRLLSPALRIEPGLLRAVRRLLPEGEADAGVEAEVWRHSWLASASPAGATIRSEQQLKLRGEFAATVAPSLRRQVAHTLRQWRAGLPEEIWFRELLSMDQDARDGVSPDDLADARQYERAFCAELAGSGAAPGRGNDLLWQERSTAAAPGFLWTDPEVGSLLVQLNHRLNKGRPDYRLPPGVTPEQIEPEPNTLPRDSTVSQIGGSLVLDATPDQPGSFLARLWSRNGLVTIEELSFWKSGTPPPWADAWGWDECGAWVEFVVGPARQRLRWIVPGTFMMGSPEDEPGHWEDEGPQHQVSIEQGYWLFDTPCTQALWQAVMEKNPSRFKSPNRPVEQVSFEDVREFLVKLNQRLPGLDLTLPSEAQWEYACRAGSSTALYTGDMEILGERNAPALHPIAWYGGNSGVDFDLKEGFDSTGWSEKQFPHERAGTHPVGLKKSNPWGLYDMLGNVWEWCNDGWHDSYEGAPTDGQAWVMSADVRRVIRGGSWHSFARHVRAACRNGNQPSLRSDNLGFRGARVQVSSASQEQAEPVLPASVRQAERRTGQGAQGLVLLDLQGGQEKSTCPIPNGPVFQVQTDCEILTFGRMTKPPWAEAVGRDRFGLWAAFSIASGDASPVTQKMRWLPPGRFLMGSPEDEPGRFESEGPRHQVTIKEGYWLFDTPCTQALWQGVMEENPSRFKSPNRPVEQVSFEDVQEFLVKLNQRLPGLDLTLPSEAQWEYACRAGSSTALYTGDMEILGENNAPALHPIAWYGGNSGVDFDLKEGHDSKGWEDKQFPHERAGTRPVGLKDANPWGLYDMLGNVWEWCNDAWHDSYEGAPTDGLARGADGSAGVVRVFRGGSWFSNARSVRAACRHWYGPSDRYYNLGFRGARVHG